ncbi:ATP-dependent helicase HrpB [Curvivirga aplysinae]|uniref:ATP-dependent helicase HrpB n=1 Tax=Curvivirga aplysinae TaxID=2529852 RepID=UPI0012BC7759|nr:ATP-dependent helicase HrpB [Curvivirga aplysinae]MTI10798.1 ATP-dependent helicase HrpB [Curvivirga aplysinae]
MNDLASNLPIKDVLPELLSSLKDTNRLVVQAPPGAGKTTAIPLALLKEEWTADGKILMLEPRRLAAKNAARHMANILGEEVGETIGYRVQMDNCVGDGTRLEILTEGILTRRLQSDPELTGISAIIFDEFHERSLQADLGLALSIDCQEGLRDDLKIIVMSATLDGQGISTLLDNAPIITSEGRAFHVETKYLGKPKTNRWGQTDIVSATVSAIKQALKEETGSILTFLPGEGEIRKVEAELKHLKLPQNCFIAPLFGAMPLAEQDKAIRPTSADQRKIVLSTNIAETSLTINGIRIVIDSGYRRIAKYNPNNGLTRLETKQISMASATQRQGRAGRVETGICYRLWDKHAEGGMESFDVPEILEADLSSLALDLANWGIKEPTELKWLDVPNKALLQQARDLLINLEILDQDLRITKHGKQTARMPMHPRLGHMILVANQYGLAKEACDLAAILSERDFLNDRQNSSLIDRIKALPNNPKSKRIKALSRHWFSRVSKNSKIKSSVINEDLESQFGLLLSLAYPDRIALLRKPKESRYQMSNGRGASLEETDKLHGNACLCIADLSGEGRDSKIRMAAPISVISLKEFYKDSLEEGSFATWDKRTRSILARKQTRLGKLILSDETSNDLPNDQIEAAIYIGIRDLGLRALPWHKESKSLLARMRCAHFLDKQNWPDVSDETLLSSLEEWLSPYLSPLLNSVRKLEDLASLDLTSILLSLLDWSQQQELDKFIPSHWQVPSGSRIRIDYENMEAPVLAVKLQEMFGATETPVVGNGKLPLTLHLLSPAQRPLQVTQNLVSFWSDSYHAVKAEMKGRYPKHPWPDDPMSHQATAKIKKRL